MNYQTAADLILLLHLAIVMFVVGGLMIILIGNLRHWAWVNAPVFRITHLGAIGTVVAESWLGLACPLTTLENWLRIHAHGAGHVGGFIESWLREILFYHAPSWVFGLVYSLFGALVLAVWFKYPARRS